jgi:hypothetical protein
MKLEKVELVSKCPSLELGVQNVPWIERDYESIYNRDWAPTLNNDHF